MQSPAYRADGKLSYVGWRGKLRGGFGIGAEQIVAQEVLERAVDARAKFVRALGEVVGLDACAAIGERPGEMLSLLERHLAVALAMQDEHAASEAARQMIDDAALLERAPARPYLA